MNNNREDSQDTLRSSLKTRAWVYGLAITAVWGLLAISDSVRPPYVSAQSELGAAVAAVVSLRVVLGWSL